MSDDSSKFALYEDTQNIQMTNVDFNLKSHYSSSSPTKVLSKVNSNKRQNESTRRPIEQLSPTDYNRVKYYSALKTNHNQVNVRKTLGETFL